MLNKENEKSKATLIDQLFKLNLLKKIYPNGIPAYLHNMST